MQFVAINVAGLFFQGHYQERSSCNYMYEDFPFFSFVLFWNKPKRRVNLRKYRESLAKSRMILAIVARV